MKSKLCLTTAVMCLALASTRSYGQTYQVYNAPTIDDIVRETVCTIPTPRTRTDIGIGETVSLSLDENSWVDKDKCIDGSTETIVDDDIGTITWSATGCGSVMPTTGSSTTTLTAESKTANYTTIVTASIEDLSTYANDDAITKTVTFNVKIPTGITVTGVVADNLTGGVDGPPNERIGAYTRFRYQVTVVPSSSELV